MIRWGFDIPETTEREMRRICTKRGVTLDLVVTKTRLQPACNARWDCWQYLESLGWSSSAIGKLWKCDHTTVLAAKTKRVA